MLALWSPLFCTLTPFTYFVFDMFCLKDGQVTSLLYLLCIALVHNPRPPLSRNCGLGLDA